jgi:hypothetical protein
MDTLLLTVAIVSLAAVAVFGAITVRLLAADRRRTAARVAALGAAIDAADPAVGPTPAARHDLFDAAAPTVGSRPLVKIAAIAAMAVFLIVVAAMSSHDPALPAAVDAAAAPAQSLELLSMRYARAGETLTVSGLVRNAGGGPVGQLTAVVFAFDKDGGFLASGRAPLEFARLGAGDESPFQVAIPRLADVGRYRVSFRNEAGTVPHIDRRSETLRASVAVR